jgi:hypothetical protein
MLGGGAAVTICAKCVLCVRTYYSYGKVFTYVSDSPMRLYARYIYNMLIVMVRAPFPDPRRKPRSSKSPLPHLAGNPLASHDRNANKPSTNLLSTLSWSVCIRSRSDRC